MCFGKLIKSDGTLSLFGVLRSMLSPLQELRAKVGCPASSLGLLTVSTREPISGEKTLAFS